ncbi:MAG: type II toxin-antitoxin system HicB family antitoxin [Pyramidobacter sp.]|nr:type II toxin-antitoxin system HicB family antitoxin [Pyramidobacter sp.]
MKDTCIYPAIFDFADDGISIEFPDLPGCLPCAHSQEEAVKNAREALGLHLWGMELNKMAMEAKVNFSQVLQDALKVKLQV